MPLGAGALAGTTFPIDREYVAAQLNFERIYGNSLDAVSDRDYIMEFLSAASILMVHLSRLSEETILWCTREFHFVELDDAHCTGSSMMPQKKNPDVSELVRGKTGRVVGHLMAMLMVVKGLPALSPVRGNVSGASTENLACAAGCFESRPFRRREGALYLHAGD